jgi:hypothetical protein
MNLRRNTIRSLMLVVVIVSFNLAVARALEPWRLAGVGPISLAIEVGLFCLIRARGRPRKYAFWAGFEAGSVFGLWSFLYVRVPDSIVGSVWDAYAATVNEFLRVNYGLPVLDRSPFDPVLLAAIVVFAFLPQLLMGLGAGGLALSFTWSRRSRAWTIALFAMVAFLIVHLAGWIAAWNALPAQPPWLIFGLTPGGLMLEFGLLALIGRWKRPERRVFWLGFVAGRSLVLWSYFRAMTVTQIPVTQYLRYGPSGPWYARPSPESPLWTLWTNYTALASYLLGRPPQGTFIVAWTNNTNDALAYSLIIFLPQLLFALAVGFLWLRVAIMTHRCAGKRSTDDQVADAAQSPSLRECKADPHPVV